MSAPAVRGPSRLVLVLGFAGFCSALTSRSVDPLVPAIARDLASTAGVVALLASAFALPYAFAQPVLGPLGDALGKGRVMRACLVALAASLALAALAPNVEMLFLARIVGGAAAGGVIPLALATIGDRVPLGERQVAISQFLLAAILGQLAGATVSGLLGAAAGWRAVFGAIGVVAVAGALARLGDGAPPAPQGFTLAGARASYAAVLANPRARVCYVAVFVEGMAIFGVLPYIAVLLEARGDGGIAEAGLVVGGLAIGGVAFTVVVRRLLAWIGSAGLMTLGGMVAAAGLVLAVAAGGWRGETAAFAVVGFGFYALHNSLQTQATELAPTARGSAVALHAFCFFLGQALGAPLYGLGIARLGAGPTILLGALALGLTGLACARLLALPPPRAG